MAIVPLYRIQVDKWEFLEVVVVLSGSCSDLYRGCLEVSSLFLVNRSNACKGRGVSKFVALFVLCQNVAIVRKSMFRFP